MLLLASLLVAAQPTPAPPPLDAQSIASSIQARLPRRFSPDVALVAASAEADLIVLTFELSEAAMTGATPETLSNRFSYGFCAAPGGPELLAGPLTLRIDARTADGRTMQGAVLDTCPVPPRRG